MRADGGWGYSGHHQAGPRAGNHAGAGCGSGGGASPVLNAALRGFTNA